MARKVSNPSNINGWDPKITYQTFLINPSVYSEFNSINSRVKNCSEDIQDIENFLMRIRNEMGNDCGCAGQINAIIGELEDKRLELIKRNDELLNAGRQVITYVSQNKQDKSEEADRLASELDRISLYKG